MAKSTALARKKAVQQSTKRTAAQRFALEFARNWQLHLMILLPFVYLAIFHYAPMYGIQMAFREFSVRDGITGSEWRGLGHFIDFFVNNYQCLNVIMNTLILSLYSIFAGFPIPVFLALVIHVNTYKGLKKIAQNISYVPHFISVVILIGILRSVLNPMSGILGSISRNLNIDYFPDIWGEEKAFRHMNVWSGI